MLKIKNKKTDKEHNENEYTYKEPTIYNCELCAFEYIKKSNYNRHLTTLKHKKTNGAISLIAGKIEQEKGAKALNEKFTCLCGKSYNYNRGLQRHRETCNYKETLCVEIQKPTYASVDMLVMMMEQLNKKDKQMEQVMEQNKQQTELLTNTIKYMIPKMGNNNNNNNTTNQFNINMFLNEECKDAINMSDFIKSIQVSIDQLQYTTNNGLGKGIIKVIMDNMNKLSKYERPLHCSDIKRETIYIKDDDKWEKDTHKDKLKKAINKTSNKNYTALCDWTRENPAFMKQDDKQNFYARTASTIGKPICDVEDKIIKSICKDNFIKE
jgi:hypothetical protein